MRVEACRIVLLLLSWGVRSAHQVLLEPWPNDEKNAVGEGILSSDKLYGVAGVSNSALLGRGAASMTCCISAGRCSSASACCSIAAGEGLPSERNCKVARASGFSWIPLSHGGVSSWEASVQGVLGDLSHAWVSSASAPVRGVGGASKLACWSEVRLPSNEGVDVVDGTSSASNERMAGETVIFGVFVTDTGVLLELELRV